MTTRTTVPEPGTVISGEEILREGLMVDERHHEDGLPRHTEREPNTALRDFIRESGGQVVDDDDLAENGDFGKAVTVIAFRRRYGLGPDVVLTSRLVAELVAKRERERQARAISGDPLLGR